MIDFWERLSQAPPYQPLRIATDPDGVDVHLSREVWETHILKRHVGMEKYREFIIPAIENPNERVWEEPDDEGRFTIRYFANIPPRASTALITRRIRVAVKYLKPTARQYTLTGLISTAFVMSL